MRVLEPGGVGQHDHIPALDHAPDHAELESLFAGDPGNSVVWQALLIIAGLTVVSLWWAARSFAKGVR